MLVSLTKAPPEVYPLESVNERAWIIILLIYSYTEILITNKIIFTIKDSILDNIRK